MFSTSNLIKGRIHWVDHDSVFPKQLKIFLKHKILTDANLIAEGKILRVHKLVLASASLVFLEMFRVNKEAYQLDMLTYDELVDLIEYIYTGTVNVYTSKIPRFVQVCKMFKIEMVFVNKPKQEEPVDVKHPEMKTEATTQTAVSVNQDDKELLEKLIDYSEASMAVEATTSKQSGIVEPSNITSESSVSKKRKQTTFDYDLLPEFKKRMVISEQTPVRTPTSHRRRLNFN